MMIIPGKDAEWAEKTGGNRDSCRLSVARDIVNVRAALNEIS
jgi:hypothetical protein